MWTVMTDSSPTNGVSSAPFPEHAPRTFKSHASRAVQRCSPIDGGSNEPADRDPPRRPPCYATGDAIHPAVEISPPDLVTRRALTGHGRCNVVEYRPQDEEPDRDPQHQVMNPRPVRPRRGARRWRWLTTSMFDPYRPRCY
jgi:hypothetical protein